MFLLAERLHKTVAEIADMSVPEFMGWQAFFAAQNDGAVAAGPVGEVDRDAPWVVQQGNGVTRWVRAGGPTRAVNHG